MPKPRRGGMFIASLEQETKISALSELVSFKAMHAINISLLAERNHC
jgi:hypothetical protein